jgi:hypothetical protein
VKELTEEEIARAKSAIRSIALAEEKLAEGSEFTKEKNSKFFTEQRDRLQKYGEQTLISPGQLFWLQDIAEQHLKRVRSQ